MWLEYTATQYAGFVIGWMSYQFTNVLLQEKYGKELQPFYYNYTLMYNYNSPLGHPRMKILTDQFSDQDFVTQYSVNVTWVGSLIGYYFVSSTVSKYRLNLNKLLCKNYWLTWLFSVLAQISSILTLVLYMPYFF